jgi:hypothetical protein
VGIPTTSRSATAPTNGSASPPTDLTTRGAYDGELLHHASAISTSDANADGCEKRLALGREWLHLRRCASCGHIGFCDSSQGKHATAHLHASDHPIIQSFEPSEEWYWCYVDEVAFEIPDGTPSPAHS